MFFSDKRYPRAYRETLALLLNTQMRSYSLRRLTIHVSVYRHVSRQDVVSIIFYVSTRRVSLCQIEENHSTDCEKVQLHEQKTSLFIPQTIVSVSILPLFIVLTKNERRDFIDGMNYFK